MQQGRPASNFGNLGRSRSGRILMGLVLAALALITYFTSTSYNEITGETQRINITAQQEIALGLQAVPEMMAQFGGLDPSREAQAYVQAVGKQLVDNSAAANAPYQFEFYLLADTQTINAFALPGGPVFITAALYDRLETEGQLAGVLAHEIAHVVARHGAERIAQAQLTEGLTGAVVVASYDPDNPNSQYAAQMAQIVGQLVNMRYGREDELESDRLGVRFMAEAGYDPTALIGVMQILAEASAGNQQPEFFSTHPNPGNRIAQIEALIAEYFPEGVPDDLIK
ncbi:MAG: M48 family metalloprotease [Anaerolineae bacterium]|nr:M48 family metalloprotease [Anaerolineae bacterium]